jgi:predicted extracellular nuclease
LGCKFSAVETSVSQIEPSTFYHFNNRDESQIDYFVESVGRVEKYITFQRESLNTSSHDPIMIVINRKRTIYA